MCKLNDAISNFINEDNIQKGNTTSSLLARFDLTQQPFEIDGVERIAQPKEVYKILKKLGYKRNGKTFYGGAIFSCPENNEFSVEVIHMVSKHSYGRLKYSLEIAKRSL